MRHSWAIGMMESRHPGPANLRNHDAVMGCLREGGLLVRDGDPRLLGPGRLHLRLRPAGKGHGVRDPRQRRRSRAAEGEGDRHARRLPVPRRDRRAGSPGPGTTTPSSSRGGSISSSTASSGFATPSPRRPDGCALSPITAWREDAARPRGGRAASSRQAPGAGRCQAAALVRSKTTASSFMSPGFPSSLNELPPA